VIGAGVATIGATAATAAGHPLPTLICGGLVIAAGILQAIS
jgi:hypothetical protein